MINLLPISYIQYRRKQKLILLGILISSIELIGGLYQFNLLHTDYKIRSMERNRLEQALKKQSYEEAKSVTKELEKVEAEVSMWQGVFQMQQEDAGINKFLVDNLLSNMPTGLILETLRIEQEAKSIYIQASVRDYSIAIKYTDFLKSLDEIEKINFEIETTGFDKVIKVYLDLKG